MQNVRRWFGRGLKLLDLYGGMSFAPLGTQWISRIRTFGPLVWSVRGHLRSPPSGSETAPTTAMLVKERTDMNLNCEPMRRRALIALRGPLALSLMMLTVTAAPAQQEVPPAADPPVPATPVDPRPDTPTPDPRPEDPAFEGVAGQIVEIRERQIVVLPNDSRQKVAFRVPEGARILINREQADLSNLKVGDRVRITAAARGSDLAREVLAARMTPSPAPRPGPAGRQQPEQRDQEIDVATSETGRNRDAGMGLVVTAANGGVMVVDAQENSPADRAGLRAGDLLASLEDQELRSPQEFVQSVREKRPGEKATLMVMRGGRAIKGDVTLARREAAPDVIIRRPASAVQPAANGAEVEHEFDVSTEVPAGTAPAGTAVAPAGGANPQPGGDLQRVERTLQLLLQEIRALRQELRGNAAAPGNQPGAPEVNATATESPRGDRD